MDWSSRNARGVPSTAPSRMPGSTPKKSASPSRSAVQETVFSQAVDTAAPAPFILGDQCPEGFPTQVDVLFMPPARPEAPKVGRQLRAPGTGLFLQDSSASPSKSATSLRKKRTEDMQQVDMQPIATIVDALREAHRHAMEDQGKYWECELAVSKEKHRLLTAPGRSAEVRAEINSEPREAAVELRAAQELRSEVMQLTEEVHRAEQQISLDEQQIASKYADARDVSSFYAKVHAQMDGAQDARAFVSGKVEDQRRRADVHQQRALAEVEKRRKDLVDAPACRFELSELRQMFRTEEQQCDEILEGNSKIREEMNEVVQGHPCPDIQADCERLQRELRSLMDMTREARRNSQLLKPNGPKSTTDEQRRLSNSSSTPSFAGGPRRSSSSSSPRFPSRPSGSTGQRSSRSATPSKRRQSNSSPRSSLQDASGSPGQQSSRSAALSKNRHSIHSQRSSVQSRGSLKTGSVCLERTHITLSKRAGEVIYDEKAGMKGTVSPKWHFNAREFDEKVGDLGDSLSGTIIYYNVVESRGSKHPVTVCEITDVEWADRRNSAGSIEQDDPENWD